ncbi:hypothetical protein ACUN8C_15455 [Kushneria sp. Sum13]|uniref:hypothetical protein n=1 Tax=Kushneria sp. Sum13 TaxID=3459196 RepID=UPI004045AB23
MTDKNAIVCEVNDNIVVQIDRNMLTDTSFNGQERIRNTEKRALAYGVKKPAPWEIARA